jgi:chorismate mutase-like protein
VSIPKHRKAIDKLDARIVRLLNERTRHVLAIGGIKVAAGEEIYAPHRERAVFDRVRKLNKGPITDGQIRAIYREIMSSALALEKKLTIAHHGTATSPAHRAAVQKFGSSLNYLPQKTVADVFYAVSGHLANYGVVPLEMSAKGVVAQTLGLFAGSDLKIVSQIHLPDGAARFLVLGRQCGPPTGDDRTSMMVWFADKAGALRRKLETFRSRKINLRAIELLSGRRKASGRLVFMECDGHVQDKKLAKAIAQLERDGFSVKVLGSYPNTD